MGRTQAQPQTHKDDIYFPYLTAQGISKAAPRQRHTSGTQAAQSLVHARGSPNLLPLPVYQGFTQVFYHSALIFTEAEQESQACLIGCL